MRTAKQAKTYRLDSVGILYLAILRKGKSNIFRMSVTLKEKVNPEMLQKALDIVTPRFPTLVAGIDGGFFRYYVIPVNEPPKVRKDTRFLGYMSMNEIKKCAMRVLYTDRKISLEVFHSLTDGYGGFAFLKALLAEYFKLMYGTECSDNANLILADQLPKAEETIDSFLSYAGRKRGSFNRTKSFLPCENVETTKTNTTTGIFDVKELLKVAHKYNVTITTLLTAVMAKSIMELQCDQFKNRKKYKPVQIMVPINLRNLFPSKTLRNFSLYALPCMHHKDMAMSFEEFVLYIERQLKEQFTRERMEAMIATNTSLERDIVLSKLPLKAKCMALKTGFQFLGKRNSSLTLTNLGEWKFPEQMQPFIETIGVYLSARTTSPYNSTVVSHRGKLYFSFSRSSEVAELEPFFFKNLYELGCVPEIEENGLPVALNNYIGK